MRRAIVGTSEDNPLFDEETIRSWLRSSYERLERRGLLATQGGRVSFRVPARDTFHLYAGGNEFSTGQPAEGTSIESLLFGQRSDAGSVIVAQPAWGSRLAEIPGAMPALFDEQVRQLGKSVETLSWMPGDTLSTSDEKKISRGDTAYLWNGNVVVVGYSLDRAVFNLELLEKCAKSFVLAQLTGEKLTRIPAWVQWIAFGRLKKDQRKASSAFARGELPSGLGGY
jgi:ribulose-5-phosphate 4-epimerase/fuculose-1-phosphate aldolase